MKTKSGIFKGPQALAEIDEAIRQNPVILANPKWVPAERKERYIVLWPVEAVRAQFEAEPEGTMGSLIFDVRNQQELDWLTRRVLCLKQPEAN